MGTASLFTDGREPEHLRRFDRTKLREHALRHANPGLEIGDARTVLGAAEYTEDACASHVRLSAGTVKFRGFLRHNEPSQR